jgi:hypothetical protein
LQCFRLVPSTGLKANRCLFLATSLAFFTVSDYKSQLEQLQQLHWSVQALPDEKHSQYIFKHPVFLQLQPDPFFTVGVVKINSGLSQILKLDPGDKLIFVLPIELSSFYDNYWDYEKYWSISIFFYPLSYYYYFYSKWWLVIFPNSLKSPKDGIWQIEWIYFIEYAWFLKAIGSSRSMKLKILGWM